MLRKTLSILLAFVFFTLLLTIAFALAGINDPESRIKTGELALARRDYAEAIRSLSRALADQGTLDQRPLTERALRARMRAYEELGNYRDAMDDLDAMVQTHGVVDRELLLKRVELTLLNGTKLQDQDILREALSLARSQATEIPKRQTKETPQQLSEALALVGASALSLHDLFLREFLDVMLNELPTVDQKLATRLLREVLARDPNDPRAQQVLRRFHLLLSGRERRFADRQADLRRWLQQAEQSFIEAMRAHPGNLRAFRGLARILEQRRDTDGLIAYSEVFLRKAEPIDAVAGAIIPVQRRLDRHEYEALVSLLDRVAPMKSWREHLQNEYSGPALVDLLVCRSLALDRLAERDHRAEEALAKTGTHFLEILETPGLTTYPGHLAHLALGIALSRAKPARAADFLSSVAKHLHSALPGKPKLAWSGSELFDIAYSKRLALSSDLGESLEMQLTILRGWASRSQDDHRPYVRLIQFQRKHGRAAEALAPALRALELSPNDEEILELYADVAVRSVQGTSRELNRLLERCQTLGIQSPDNVGDLPILLLPLAERALRAGFPAICRASATQVLDIYPWARRPRLLRIEAALALEDRTAALQDLEIVLRYYPEEARVLPLLSQVLPGGTATHPRLRFVTALQDVADVEVAVALAQGLLRQKQHERADTVARRSLVLFGPRPELAIAGFEALLGAGSNEDAASLLSRLYKDLLANPSPPAGSDLIVSRYLLHDPDKLAPAEHDRLLLAFVDRINDAEVVFDLARRAKRLGKYVLADRLLDQVFEQQRFSAQRRAEFYLLAGECALLRDAPVAARAYLTAALSFPEGRIAATDLAVLAALRNDVESATQALASAPELTTRAAALQALIGDQKRALAICNGILGVDDSDLPTMAVLAVLQEDAVVPPQLREVAMRMPQELLRVCLLLSTTGLPKTTLRQADDLLKRFKNNAVVQILHARALHKALILDDVVPALLALDKDAFEDPLLRTEALRTLDRADPDALREPRVRFELFQLCQALGAATPPALLAMTFRLNMDMMRRNPDLRAKYVPVMTGLWLRDRVVGQPGLEEAKLLGDAGDPHHAMRLLFKIEDRIPNGERRAWINLLYSQARAILANNPARKAELLAMARKQLQRQPVYGAPLHFLLDATEELWGGTLDTVGDGRSLTEQERSLRSDARLLLEQHIQSFKDGHDPDLDNLLATLRRLGMHESPEQSLQRLDDLLTHDLSHLELWQLRATWLANMGRNREAEASLRWILRYLPDERIQDHLLDLVEQEIGLDELERIQPTSNYGLGILKIRQAKVWEGFRMLELVEPRLDGLHVFKRGIALLGWDSPHAEHEVRTILNWYVDHFPDAPRAGMARDLASMLQQGQASPGR